MPLTNVSIESTEYGYKSSNNVIFPSVSESITKHIQRIRKSREDNMRCFFAKAAYGLEGETKDRFIENSIAEDRPASLCQRESAENRAGLRQSDAMVREAVDTLAATRRRLTEDASLAEITDELIKRSNLRASDEVSLLFVLFESMKLNVLEEVSLGNLAARRAEPLLAEVRGLQGALRAHYAGYQVEPDLLCSLVSRLQSAVQGTTLSEELRNSLIDASKNVFKIVLENPRNRSSEEEFDDQEYREKQSSFSPQYEGMDLEQRYLWKKLQCQDLSKYFKKNNFINQNILYLREYVREAKMEDVLKQRGIFGRAQKVNYAVRLPVLSNRN